MKNGAVKDDAVKNIVVVGGGGHAKVVISLIKKLTQYRLLGFTDPQPGPALLGAPHLGDDSELERLARDYAPCSIALGIGNIGISARRLEMAKRVRGMGFDLPALISPTAVINEEVTVGDGTVIFDGAVVVTGTRIGAACILNTGCLVDHDSRLGDGVHIAPGAVLCGGVEVGDLAMVSSGAVVIQYRKIGERCLIAAGATVTQDIHEPGVYAGTPAKRLK